MCDCDTLVSMAGSMWSIYQFIPFWLSLMACIHWDHCMAAHQAIIQAEAAAAAESSEESSDADSLSASTL